MKYIPVPEHILVNANHKTGKLKNEKYYQPNEKEHKRQLRKSLLKTTTNKAARYKIRKMSYQELIALEKKLRTKI